MTQEQRKLLSISIELFREYLSEADVGKQSDLRLKILNVMEMYETLGRNKDEKKDTSN